MALKIDLTEISDDELLIMVKELLDYGDNDFDDNKLRLRIEGAKQFLLMCDVPEVVVNSKASVEVIASYVNDRDLYNDLTDFTLKKVIQLRMVKIENV